MSNLSAAVSSALAAFTRLFPDMVQDWRIRKVADEWVVEGLEIWCDINTWEIQRAFPTMVEAAMWGRERFGIPD